MSVVIDGVHPDDRDRVLAFIDDNDERLAAGKSLQAEHRVVRPDGEVRWVEARAFPVHDDSGEVSEVIGVTLDITDRKRNQLELERQNQRLDRFAQVVSHDLRNPLATARGYLGLVEEDTDHPHLERIDQALARMDELVTDVLALARDAEVEDEKRVDLGAVARTAWATVGTRGCTLTVADDLEPFVGDASYVRQLLENLFRNSVEHGGDGVEVRVGPLDGEDGAGFYVADDGPGVPADEREQVFEIGHTTSQEGTGLGLSIVRDVADAHDWTVSVGDSAGGGARFEMTNVEPVGSQGGDGESQSR
jgi:signal transduction histidine kinase